MAAGEERRGGMTTASVEALPLALSAADPTAGLVLIYSRLHAHLPSIVPFASSLTSLGREADNTLPIPEAAVSRHHARVERREDGYWIEDLGSTNGTLVNGARLERARLADHDVVRVGDSIFRFAAEGVYRFAAYSPGGRVTPAAQACRPAAKPSSLVGGYAIDRLLVDLEKVASTPVSILVSGETGTGKELIARYAHSASGRRGPLSAINCAALPEALIESELFGVRRGAFTGANADRPGLLRAAHGGTLFLDEVGDMPLGAQAKLLRVLQEREVLPLGGTRPEPIDLRVISATHRDLDAEVASGRFRGDLLARLREFSVMLPPLRRRREDLLPLVRHFQEATGAPVLEPTLPFMLALAHHDWPYNVRELESAVRVAQALAGDRALDLPDLPPSVRRSLDDHGTAPAPHARPSDPSAGELTEAPSEQALRALLARHGGNIAAAGREIGKARMQIHRWMKRYAIEPEEYRR